ncbi:putative non-specific serine/threonine protein kinase [Helianthus annuus]|nr:putative non-specific serine/threonine protein kinase [Helianthus annuus]
MDRPSQTGDTNNLKSKISNPCALICHSCLLLAAVAQSLKSTGRNSALFMLTSSTKKQHSRLSDLAHHYSLCDRIQNSFQPHSMSVMLALASILSIESNSCAGIPASIIQCLKHVDLKDAARPVAFLAKMTGHGPLVVQLLGKGLLNSNTMRRLLDNSSPREVKVDVLMIVSDVARMHKDFYEHIKGADILEHLKGFLTHEDPNIRAKACSALGNMCRHNSYFYSLLVRINRLLLT